MNLEEKEQYWRKHYEGFKNLNISKNEYCRINFLNVSNVKKWFYKFDEQSNGKKIIPKKPVETIVSPSNFSIIEVKPEIVKTELIFRFQFNGFTLEMNQLPEPQWLAVLSKQMGV